MSLNKLRVGPYEILEETALGGMGAVYRAIRADGHYRQQVALKIVRAELGTDLTIARFRNERQILAGLDHPNIAKILDGGSTADGLPYLVMEFVDGLAIDEYCSSHKLTVNQRLKLFLQVCFAVQFAHQHLIIHRDIKPGNILVTADGTPKLLDFGIAKLLAADGAEGRFEPTLTMFRVLTPGYASPEQVKGERITTASDVYSLGVVLYELLTGCHPYRHANGTPEEIARSVCEVEPEKPSTAVRRTETGDQHLRASRANPDLLGHSAEKLSKRLKGDLDNILLMALRKEPQRRYESAGQLAEDIRRHLDDLPVIARKDTLRYGTAKFIRRNKAMVTTSAVVVVTLMMGMAITLHEARVAREQQQRADRRFNDLRKLANSLIFEIHDSIRDLPGATRAREVLVRRALEYLDSLSQESGDPALQREIAAAYDRIGDVQGYTGAANLDDFEGASKSYAKALAILESLAAGKLDDGSLRSELVQEYFKVANILQNLGDFEGELRTIEKAQPLMGRLRSDDNDGRFRTARMHYYTGRALERLGDYPGALVSYQQAASTLEPLADAGNAKARSYIAEHYNGIAKVLARMGRNDEAVTSAAKARDILEKLLSAYPQNATFLGYLGENYDATTDVLTNKGDLVGALRFALQTQAVYKRLLSADPGNQMARADIAWSDVSIAEILLRENKPQEAIRHIQNAVINFNKSGPSEGYWTSVELGQSYLDLGKAYAALAERAGSKEDELRLWREAKSWDEEARKVRRASPGQRDDSGVDQMAEISRQLARCEAHMRVSE